VVDQVQWSNSDYCAQTGADQEARSVVVSRLNYMSDIELAILTIQEELDCLERHVASGGSFDDDDARVLLGCLQRLAALVAGTGQPGPVDWETSKEPLPPWLQPKPEDRDEGEKPLAKKA
jgi:hypothetical protein